MFKLLVIFSFIIVFSPNIVFSQENDDMYFTSSDRKDKKKIKKITPANVILSNYRKGVTNVNAANLVDKSIVDKYKSEPKNTSITKNNSSSLRSLKYERDNLYISSSINSKILDFSFMMLSVRPYYHTILDPYYYNSLMVLDPFTSGFYGGGWMLRSLHGFRNLAVSNPSIFFSNPYLSSLYPMMSPALINMHAGPCFALYGCNDFLRHFPWIMTNNGTGGGKYYGYLPVHNNMNISNKNNSSDGSVVVRGPRKGRGFSINGENIVDPQLDNRFYRGRRESGITNENRQRELDEDIRNGTQNSFLRDRTTGNNNLLSSRSSRSTIMQNTNRRSSNQYRNENNMADAINDYFQNSNRRSVSSENWMSSRGSSGFTTSNDGRRTNYSYKPYAGSGDNRTSNFNNSNRSSNSFGGFRNNSGGGSNWGSSGSGNFNGGGSSGGGGAVVRAGSSGGSSRGNN